MDRYHSKIARLFRPLGFSGEWAVTLGQTTFFTCGPEQVDARWRRHEDCHKRQWAQDGRIRFAFRYLWQGITKGYWNIDYEIEARQAEENG